MIRLQATIWKEILLLRRDRAGILVLFLMPAVLVVVITLVQQNVLKIMGETGTSILLIDRDGGGIGQLLEKRLAREGRIRLVGDPGNHHREKAQALAMVAHGQYQLCLVVPSGTSLAVTRQAQQLVTDAGAGNVLETGELPEIPVYFDPTVSPGFRRNMLTVIRLVLLEYEVQEKVKALSNALRGGFREAGLPVPDSMDRMLSGKRNWQAEPLINLEERAASAKGVLRIPDAIQQNVPAWSVFGMFFVVVPLAGSLLRERASGAWVRLLSLPVSPLTLMSGKVIAYLIICFCQFGLIVFLGRFFLPILGTSPFTVEPGQVPAVLLIILGSSLAATGFGILLGAVCRTFEQASMLGAIAVVLAAAVGGVMVPVYAMPDFMQHVSKISPLGWSLTAFHDILVRRNELASIASELILLFGFFGGAMLASVFVLFSRK